MKRGVKIISILFIITLFFNSVVKASNYEDFEKELAAIKEELENSNRNLEGIEREINFILIGICDIDKNIAITKKQKESTEKKIEEAKKNIEASKAAMEEVENVVETDNLYYEQRVRTIYENGTLDFWDVVLTSKSVTDFLKRYNMLTSIIETDKRLYENIRAKKNKLEKAKETVEVKTTELEIYKKERDTALKGLVAEKDKREDLVNKLRKDKELALAESRRFQSEINEVSTKLEKEVLSLLMAYNGTATPGGITGTPNKKGYVWPVGGSGGTLTAGFPNYPSSFGGGKHDGLDIASVKPVPVRACNKGKIVKAVTGYGNTYPYAVMYGNYVVIVHEDGITTSLYGHLESVNCKVGDKVKAGQQIGVMGSSGYSTGRHLHFEIRIKGVPQQPLSYVNN